MEQTIHDRIVNFKHYREGVPFSIANAVHQLGNTYDEVSVACALNSMVIDGLLKKRVSDTRGVNIYSRAYSDILRKKWVKSPPPTEYSPQWIYHDESMR